MEIVAKAVHFLTGINKWIAYATLAVLMFFITLIVVGRNFGFGLSGDVELIQMLVVVLIMASLSYTQLRDEHISIGLLTDRFPGWIQPVLDVFRFLLTAVVCGVIAYIFFKLALGGAAQAIPKSTNLLRVPHYPLQFFIAFGFAAWGLESLLKAMLSAARPGKPAGG